MTGLKVQVDWNRDGDFTDVGDDVTTFVRREAGLSVSYGRDQTTALAPTVSGQGSFTLGNESRRFSPRNTSSPLYGLLRPARPVRVTRTVAGVDYPLFDGHTDDSPINPDVSARDVSLTLVDWLADFRSLTISTALYSGIRTGRAVGYILDACGWPLAKRDLDGGATVIPWWWESGADAMAALESVVRSEGPPAMLTVGSDGSIIFRDRHHRLQRPRSTSAAVTGGLFPDATLFPSPTLYPGGAGVGGVWRSDGTVQPVMGRGFTYNEAWDGIVNAASVSVDVRSPQSRQVVWTNDSTVTLTANESTVITASGSDPCYNAAAEYTVAAGSVTVTLLRKSGAAIPIVLAAGGAGARVDGLQLRANPVSVTSSVQVSARDEASISDYGSRSMLGDLPWCSVADARAVVETAVATRAQPLPVLSARFLLGTDAAKAGMLLTRDLSDRVHVVEDESVVDADFYIESIGHELTGDFDHTMVFGVEAAPLQVANAVRLDTAGAGLDQGFLASPFIDPENLIVLDSSAATHKLNGGLLAA